MPKIPRTSGLLCLLIAGMVLCPRIDADQPAANPHLDTLKKNGIAPTLAGVKAYLESLDPQHESQRERVKLVATLISQLNDDRFTVREQAHVALLRMPETPTAELRAAAQSDDQEKAWRAASILKQAASSKRPRTTTLGGVTEAVCATIRHDQLQGVAAGILAALPRFEDRATIEALNDALLATVEPGDVGLLQQSLQSPNVVVKMAAIRATEALLGAESHDEIAKLLDDPDATVRLTAAHSLANHSDRRALSALAGLLDADAVDVRVRAVQILRGLTGQRFRFLAYETAEKRMPSVREWHDWIQGDGQTAKLLHPLRLRYLPLGRTIITDYGRNRVIEVDENGKTIWELAIEKPWDCQGLPNGHRVISSYGQKLVVEYDAEGKEVWRKDGLPDHAMGLHRMENGNTLVACSHSKRVVEYALDGSVIWDVTITGRPVDVHRLDNGLTLVALESGKGGQKVVEVDDKGEIVWQIPNIHAPLSAQRLDNGNTLVAAAQMKKCVEYERDGKIVWEASTPTKATCAHRLTNGNTLIATESQVQMISQGGKVKWTVKDLKHCYGITHY